MPNTTIDNSIDEKIRNHHHNLFFSFFVFVKDVITMMVTKIL